MPAPRPSTPHPTAPGRRAGWVARWLLLLAPATLMAGPSQPLGPRSLAPGSTLFTLLSAEQTGIHAPNAYDDPAMWRERYREFSLGAIGTGVAIGDYDQDGLPDVFIVSKTGGNRLFKNLGAFRFDDVTTIAGVAGPLGAWKTGSAFADVDNDGLLDLYVCRYGAANLLYINQGDGTFKEEGEVRGVAVVDASGHAAFVDYDRDGHLDFFLQTNVLDAEARPNGQRDYLFRNNGDGTFTNTTEIAGLFGEAQGHSSTWWDYNEDGWPDIYVANDFKDPDQLYRNNGDGTFTNVLSWVVPHTPHSSMGADLGDVNNDGHIDLLVADMAATTRNKDHRGMAKLRSGLPESDSRPTAAPQYMRNALFLNLGHGRTLEAAFLTGLHATDWTWSVRFEDLDNDGWQDVLFTTGMIRELHSADLVTKMIAIESISERTRPMHASPVLAENNLAFRNRGDLQFERVEKAWGLDRNGVTWGAAYGDLDGDGDLDLIQSNYDAPATVYRNDSPHGNRVILSLRGTHSNRFGVGTVARAETQVGIQTRQLVLARGYVSTSEPVLHFGLGTEERIRRLTLHWPSGAVQTLENVEAGQHHRVTEPADPPGPPARPPSSDVGPVGQFVDVTAARGLELSFKEASLNELTRQPLLAIRLNRQGPSAAAADLDGDGADDLCVGGATNESGRFLFNSGDGHFLPYGSSVFTGATQTADAGLLFFDVDGDGDRDLLSTKGGTARDAKNAAYHPRLFSNDGTGRFALVPDGVPPIPLSASSAVAADYNRDGKLDVVIAGRVVPWTYPAAPGSLLLENQDGRLVDVTEARAPALKSIGLVTAALWSDVNDDGWPDLLLAREWDTVACLLNENGERLVEATDKLGFQSGGRGWWNSLAAADFNGDGRMDYAAGNVGLNTMYRASPEHPAVLYWGKLDPAAKTALIEAQYEGDTLYPVRPLGVFTAALPTFARKFPNYEAYAPATLTEVIPEATLAGLTRVSATSFESGVFLSQPEGTHRFVAFPRLVQTAPIFGLQSADFDGDGRMDICVVQNSHAPIPEVGRFDGGLGWLLRGDGKGGFEPVPPAKSGFVVTGDGKALVLTDYNADGWADIFITRNNQRSLALQNGGVEGRRPLQVALKGPRGNLSAIGARVSVHYADGTSAMGEIHGGSGYLSQSTAAVFFGFPEGNPPVSFNVRWPDGSTTSHPWTNETGRIVLSQPSP